LQGFRRQAAPSVLDLGPTTVPLVPPLSQGPYDESIRYRDFMGWDMPWYSAQPSLDALLGGRQSGAMYLVCYLRDGDRVYETYWTTLRGVVGGLSPDWPQQWENGPTRMWTNGRPISQWSRLESGRSDDLTVGP
jgi:hypothetical protein